mmetsp:Transcript_99528/g.176640  ORF Transcript_99528/g.176640 Transcript_99528/m.176640 type:complete len:84 (-) Transcript_99528:491-742(-)
MTSWDGPCGPDAGARDHEIVVDAVAERTPVFARFQHYSDTARNSEKAHAEEMHSAQTAKSQCNKKQCLGFVGDTCGNPQQDQT